MSIVVSLYISTRTPSCRDALSKKQAGAKGGHLPRVSTARRTPRCPGSSVGWS